MRLNSKHGRTIAGLTLLAVGCGSGPIGDGDDEIGETGSSETDSGETDSSETDSSETGDGDACLDAEGTLIVDALRLDAGADRAWMLVDGGELELALEGPASDTIGLVGAAAGSRIALGRSTGAFDEPQQTTLHGFDRATGALIWTRELAGVWTPQLWVADDGWISGTANPYQVGQLVGFAMSDDQAVALPNHQPLAAPSAGVVAAQEVLQDSTLGEVGWIALADSSWTPAAPPPLQTWDVLVGEDDRTLEYVAAEDLGPVFVRATPEGAALIDLSIALPGPDDDSVALIESAGDYRLIQSVDPQTQTNRFVRVDVALGEVSLIEPEPPAGWSWFDCYSRTVRLDADGALLFELRDGASARAWAYEPEGAQWSEVGLAVSGIDDIDFAAQFGSVHVVRAAAQFTTFCPPVEWGEPPPDAVVGESLQLVRRSPALATTLPTTFWSGQVRIDAQERCVAHSNERGWWVRALGDESDLGFGPPVGEWLWLD